MSGERFVAVGHVTNDLKPKEHLGGGVSYSAVTASRLGLDAHIITKCPQKHPYINELKNLRIKVHVLPSTLPTITTFDNQYDLQGRRKQIITQVQEQISLKDKENIPWKILKDSVILVAPVTPIDVDMKLFSDLTRYGSVNVIPQGYFRKIAKNGLISPKRWKGLEKYILNTKIVVLSEEDILINGLADNVLREEIINACPLVALTQGAGRVMIYEKGREVCRTKAFPLLQEELMDFEGSGDVFATAFIVEMIRNSGNIKAASVAACLFAAMKITGMGGIGIDSIPTRRQITEFLKKHNKRIKAYLKSEGLNSSKLGLHVLK